MLKINNQKTILDLAKMTYRANKKRNILTIIAIFLTTFLICTVLSIGLSYWNTLSVRQQRMQGMDYDIELTEPREEQVCIIRQMDNVKYAGLGVKCAIISQYGQKEVDKIKIFWIDSVCWKKQTIPALEYYKGRYPQKENELMLSKAALHSMGIEHPEIGMELPITYQTLAEDSTGADIKKTFVLSGWFLDYTGEDKGFVSSDFYKTTGVKQTDLTQGMLKISLKNPLYTEEDITNMQKQIGITGNQIIEADYDTIENFCKTMAGLLLLLCMVFFSGYLFIYNTLYLSVNKDISYYGQLKTIGTTSAQIKKIIQVQMLWNVIAGIPLGLLASYFVGKGIIPELLHTVNPTISTADVGGVPIWIFAIATAFSFFTTWISSQKPAGIAMYCSPIEALRYIGNIHRKTGKNKKRQGGDLFSMARQNLFRDKKQCIVIISSLSLAVILFMVIHVVIYANNAAHILNTLYDCDMQILNQTLLTDQEQQVITDTFINRIQKVEGVKDVRVLKAVTATVPYQENVYGDYYKELYDSRYSPGNYEEDMALYKKQPDYHSFTCRIIGVDRLEFKKINQKLENPVNEQAFVKGKVAIASKMFTEGDNGITGKTVRFSIPEGMGTGNEEQISIGAVISDNPAYYAAGYNPDLIVSEDYFDTLVETPLIEMIKIDYDTPFSAQTETEILDVVSDYQKVSTESKLERYKEMKTSENQVTVLGNSMGIIVMFLAISNYINMMSVSIQNRSKEFAILESIGMTRKQLKIMITMESLSYGFLSILAAIVFGLPLSYYVFFSFNLYNLPFQLPMLRNGILFVIILFVCVATTLFVLSRSKQETIIELLNKI